jgi:hypothetical protein
MDHRGRGVTGANETEEPPGSAMSSPSLRDAYAVNRPAVVSELIDGETVMMHLETGHYFSARGTASRIWSWVELGLSSVEMLDRLDREYAADRAVMEEALAAFLAALADQGLVVAGAPPTAVAPDAGADCSHGDGERAPFVAPVLEVYADMRDLLFLDPIHDVDESGWPSAVGVHPG